jgi:hypothetical protein
VATHDSREVQEEVRQRLDEQGVRLSAGSYRQFVDNIVWETLAVLGEWELIQLDPLARKEEP